MSGHDPAHCIIDGANGIYTPQAFATSYVVIGSEFDDAMTICASGPDHPDYWDAWSEITDAATVEGMSGIKWSVYLGESGDVFAVHPDAEWSDEDEWFTFPTSQPVSDDPDKGGRFAQVNWTNDYADEVPTLIALWNLVREDDPETRSR